MDKKRPILTKAITEGQLKEEELFQNMVLRPVIKMQHKLLVIRLNGYLKAKKIAFSTMDLTARTIMIEDVFQKDIALKKEVQGMVLGQLDEFEYKTYLKFERSMNKRIAQMVKNRMKDALLELNGQ